MTRFSCYDEVKLLLLILTCSVRKLADPEDELPF